MLESEGWISVEGIPVRITDRNERTRMSFRLIYEGELLAAGTGDRAALRRNKHAIRRQLHPQLKKLWETERLLQYYWHGPITGKEYPGDQPIPKDEGLNYISKKYERCGCGFVPLIGVGQPGEEDPEEACSLDILFLRREPPGAVVRGGDIDNRLKTLFDGLTLPQSCEDIEPPDDDEKPMYILLRDDSLISEMNVSTDLLLRPPKDTGKHDVNDVVLIIRATLLAAGALGVRA